MIKNITTSFGSESILSSIKKNNLDRQMILLSSTSKKDSFQLVDASGMPNVFKSPIRYQVLQDFGVSIKNGLFIFNFFSLAEDECSSFDKNIQDWTQEHITSSAINKLLVLKPLDVKPANRALLSVWDNQSSDYTNEFNAFKKIIKPYINKEYFQTSYTEINEQ